MSRNSDNEWNLTVAAVRFIREKELSEEFYGNYDRLLRPGYHPDKPETWQGQKETP